VLLIVFLFQNYEAFLAATTLEFRLRVLPPLNSGPIPLYALILGSIFGGGVMTTLYLGLGNLRLRKIPAQPSHHGGGGAGQPTDGDS
jgi:hypothetical protein